MSLHSVKIIGKCLIFVEWSWTRFFDRRSFSVELKYTIIPHFLPSVIFPSIIRKVRFHTVSILYGLGPMNRHFYNGGRLCLQLCLRTWTWAWAFSSCTCILLWNCKLGHGNMGFMLYTYEEETGSGYWLWIYVFKKEKRGTTELWSFMVVYMIWYMLVLVCI